MNISAILKLVTLLLIFVSRAYWFYTKRKALAAKPKNQQKPIIIEKLSFGLFGAFLIANLFGYVAFPFSNIYFQIFGFVLVILGFGESMLGRKELASNWTESYDYQIKKEHKLVTTGIYLQVRHPIYGGLWLFSTGALILSGTYLFIPISLLTFIFLIKVAEREEKILTKHFDNKYLNYQKETKQLLPAIY